MFCFLAMQAMFQAVGEVRFAMLVQIGSILCNALLDPLLIFGLGPFPALGVAGAALATVIVQTAALAIALRHLLSGHSALHLRIPDFRPDWAHVRRAAALGIPASLELGIRTFSSLLLMSLAASFGTLGLAAYGVGTRLLFFWFMPMTGLSNAASEGHNRIVKHVGRVAFGFRNPTNQRRRIRWARTRRTRQAPPRAKQSRPC
jgi:Na+-driven multidrug efflux pump